MVEPPDADEHGIPTHSLDSQTRRRIATILWEACRRVPDPAVLSDAISRGADMEAACALAVRHRIGPLLWRALDGAGVIDGLGDAGRGLAAVAKVHEMEAMLLFPRAVSAALDPLVDAGLEPVVLKGPALAARYPHPGLRPMEDIDVLLPAEHHPDALRLLARAGWRVARPASSDRYDTQLVHEEVPTLALELHYGLEARYEKVTSLDPASLWKLREPIDCLGTPAFGLPLPEEIVVLAAHAGKPYHGFSRLLWISDLAMIVGHHLESGAEVEWDRVRSVAASGRCATVVGVALVLARHAGVDSPRGLFRLPESRWRASALAKLLDPSWPVEAQEQSTFHLRYALTDGALRRVHLLIGTSHGKSASDRVKWIGTVPISALSRWRSLRREPRSTEARSPAASRLPIGDTARGDFASACGASRSRGVSASAASASNR